MALLVLHNQGGYWRLFLAWLWTTVFTIATLGVALAYQEKVLTPIEKGRYNFLTTALFLFIGLSSLEVFKEVAKSLGRHLCNWFNPKADDQNLLNGFDGLLNVIRLIVSGDGWWLRLCCLSWLLINMVVLVLPTVINFSYSLEDGKDYNGIYTRNGLAKVSNTTCYFRGKDCPGSFVVTTHQLAHSYGDTTLAADSTSTNECGSFTDTESIVKSKRGFRYYCRRNTTIQEFGIRFNQYNPSDLQQTYPYFTNRTITAFSGRCNEYSQIGEGEETMVGNPDRDGNNFISAFKYTYTNNTANGSIVIPTSALGREGTTYIYRGVQTPPNEKIFAYGTRGLWIWVYRNPGFDTQPWFYECPVTVNPVTNVVNPAHNISDGMAREAVASIALQGQFKGPLDNPDFTQWQWYASGHPWEIHYHNNSRVGANIAEHAIVSLAEMVARNPKIETYGDVPHLGSRLTVKWRILAGLVTSIIGISSLAAVVGVLIM